MLNIAVVNQPKKHRLIIENKIHGVLFETPFEYRIKVFHSLQNFLKFRNQVHLIIVDIDEIDHEEFKVIMYERFPLASLIFISCCHQKMSTSFGKNVIGYIQFNEIYDKLVILLRLWLNQEVLVHKAIYFKRRCTVTSFIMQEISAIYYEDRKIYILQRNGQVIYASYQSFTSFLKSNPQLSLVKINASTAINLNAIKSLSSDSVLIEGAKNEFPISYGLRKEVKKIFNDFTKKSQ